MPLLKIQTNQALEAEQADSLIRAASQAVAGMLGKPESYVLVQYEPNPHMLFAGTGDPLAYLELKSIGLPEDRTAELSSGLCELIENQLDIPQDRIYIEFANAKRHMWGWKGATF